MKLGGMLLFAKFIQLLKNKFNVPRMRVCLFLQILGSHP